jgi:hypothetical protein
MTPAMRTLAISIVALTLSCGSSQQAAPAIVVPPAQPPDAAVAASGADTAAADASVIIAADAAGVADAPPAPDAAPPTSDGPFMGTIPDGAPWQRMCPAAASRADCCALYCACMVKYCPATLPGGCQAACEAGQSWDLVCRTYQCFASQNPSFPQDHDSHCRHAIGQQGRCGNR